MRLLIKIPLYACILLVGIASVTVVLAPRQAARAYNGVRWRLQAGTGISLPRLRPAAASAASEDRAALTGAPVQPEQEAEELQLMASLPGHAPDGSKKPFQRPEYLSPLPQPFQTLLLSMHQFKPQKGIDGIEYPLSFAGIVPEDGMFIYDLCRKLRPQRTLEIGFAEGFSTMYFLAAAKSNGTGSHVAVDPFEKQDWHGQGLQKVEESGMKDQFRFMETKSIAALPALAAEGLKFDVIFIDGDHRYDSQLVDFVLSDALTRNGSYILLHDIWMASTRKLMSFIDRNRADYKRHPTSVDIAAYEKIGDDRRGWRHFISF